MSITIHKDVAVEVDISDEEIRAALGTDDDQVLRNDLEQLRIAYLCGNVREFERRFDDLLWSRLSTTLNNPRAA